MRKIIALVVLMAFVMPVLATTSAFAAVNAEKGVTDVGNKFCPVTGDSVSGQNFVTYQGKRYGLCCPMCEKPFLKNTAKYIAKSEAQEKTAQVSGKAPISTMGSMTTDMRTQAPAEEHSHHNM